MYGAILGDIIGEPYEFDRGNKTKDFPLFSSRPRFTDDTVMTIAICDGILRAGPDADESTMKNEMIKSMQRWGHKYPHASYGQRFYLWLASEDTKPYGSYGNGSAMRVSSVGWLFETLERTREVARWSAEITHNHPEGIKGAESSAAVIWMARNGYSKNQIKEYVIKEFGYDLSRTCDEIRPQYHHVESCQETVPEAITAFLEGRDFEDVIRTAVSLGGDCDTLTDIAGGMAEAFYGIPEELETKCIEYTADDMHKIFAEFEMQRIPAEFEKHETATKKMQASDISAILKGLSKKRIKKEIIKMSQREVNTLTMDSTQELCSSLISLRKSIDDSIKKEYVVFEDGDFSVGPLTANEKMEIIVSGRRTFEAAENYRGKKICCLDFANNHNMGGSPWTSNAQEEAMCRISTLYPCLAAKENEFYEKHWKEFEDGMIDDMGSDDLIYIPGVTVFKTDEAIPKLKKEEDWFKTDVIVSAAPVLDYDYDSDQYRSIMTKRIKRILDVAAKEKVEVLILGAFGCGAFRNPPEIVADIFASLIRGYDFETVEFAVFCRDDKTNFEAFESRFSNRSNP